MAQEVRQDRDQSFGNEPAGSSKTCCPAIICNKKPTPAPEKILGTCWYYVFRHVDFLLRHVGCGHSPPDYYLKYGWKYCMSFSNELRPKLSPQGQAWLDKARLLLQNYMEDGLRKNPEIELDNEKFREFAFQTHPDAYWNAGFHSISVCDKGKVVAQPEIMEWLDSSTRKQALEMFLRELNQYWSDFSDEVKHEIAKTVNEMAKQAGQTIKERIEHEIREAIERLLRLPLPRL